ncbi:MAG: ribonucleoside-diphosphate reductase subunit alpha [Legionellales bacterium]|nr:ribonucleoside-diphosphate reductase subunit alpha [Legionellales bacterium]
MHLESEVTVENPISLSELSTHTTSQIALNTNQPGIIRVIRRNGKITHYDDCKIQVAMTKAFLATEGGTAAASARVHEVVATLTEQISQAFHRRLIGGGTIHIEDIQDQVELTLMRSGHHKVARAYVLYREERRKLREAKHADLGEDDDVGSAGGSIFVMLPNGGKIPLDKQRLRTILTEACEQIDSVNPELLLQETLQTLFDGVPHHEVSKALVLAARTHIELEPNYTYVSARLLLNLLRSEALQFLGLGNEATFHEMKNSYAHYFLTYLQKGIELELIDPKLQTLFDLEQISQALLPERDLQFTYLGLQTLYDRYFIHSHDQRFELPQAFFMRVAMGLAINEEHKTKRAIEFYQLLSSFDFMSSTPALFNSGTLRPQLSSCFLTTIPDDLDGIYSAIKDNALLSKFAGGLGNDWTPVRAMGAKIKGTNGKSQGVIPFMNVVNASAVAVNQGGKRKGAICGYLETWHIDIEDFLELRKNTGDDRRRTHDMNTANWIPDLFMKRVYNNQDWTLFSPDETPDLHDTFGLAFEKLYQQYEEKAARGEIKNVRKIKAVNLWRKMLSMLFETGHPWLTFKDPCNIRSPQQHVGVVHSSNLCTEITLNTSSEEIAVCNLGSLNLANHLDEDGLNLAKLEKTITTAVRMLDNVIDINYYTVAQARRSNLKHRPIGLGIMGFQDALYQQKISYASDAAVEFADYSMEAISYYAIKASSDLARERGTYASFENSLWSQGILPLDSIKLLQQTRGDYLDQDTTSTFDWASLRMQVRTVGMRNSNVMAIAPTATISNICGVTQSIEPTYQNLFVKSNLSGEFTVINPYLVNDLKALNLWDAVMVNDLKYFDGSVEKIDRIPLELKTLYATAFEIDPTWLVEAASRRQKWIDQAQSLNLYMAEPSGKKLDALYRLAWIRGLKTTYYLRSLGATNAEKSTIQDNTLNAVANTITVKACSITDPDCEACQ